MRRGRGEAEKGERKGAPSSRENDNLAPAATLSNLIKIDFQKLPAEPVVIKSPPRRDVGAQSNLCGVRSRVLERRTFSPQRPRGWEGSLTPSSQDQGVGEGGRDGRQRGVPERFFSSAGRPSFLPSRSTLTPQPCCPGRWAAPHPPFLSRDAGARRVMLAWTGGCSSWTTQQANSLPLGLAAACHVCSRE